ncbi:MAG: cytidine deaminase, partial [Bacillota bacterium]
LSNCAERTAIFRAVSRGYNEFKAIMIVSNGDKPVAPCGACRQVIREFGEDIEVIMTTTDGNTYSRSIGELLPEAFNKGDLSS